MMITRYRKRVPSLRSGQALRSAQAVRPGGPVRRPERGTSLKLARTIADLEGATEIKTHHLLVHLLIASWPDGQLGPRLEAPTWKTRQTKRKQNEALPDPSCLFPLTLNFLHEETNLLHHIVIFL